MWEDNRGGTFSMEEVLLWIIDPYFGQKRQFKVKNDFTMDLLQIRSFSRHKMLIDGLVMIIVTLL